MPSAPGSQQQAQHLSLGSPAESPEEACDLRSGWAAQLTHRLLLGGDELGLLLQLGAEGVDLALGLGCCLSLVLSQGRLQPLILLLQLVGTGRASSHNVPRTSQRSQRPRRVPLTRTTGAQPPASFWGWGISRSTNANSPGDSAEKSAQPRSRTQRGREERTREAKVKPGSGAKPEPLPTPALLEQQQPKYQPHSSTVLRHEPGTGDAG